MIGSQSLEAWKGTILVEDYEECLLFKSCSEVIVFTDKCAYEISSLEVWAEKPPLPARKNFGECDL